MKNSRFPKMHHYAAFCKSSHMCVWVHVSVCLCVMYSELEIRIGLKVGTFYRLLLASPLRVISIFVLANWICLAKSLKQSENGRWSTLISSSGLLLIITSACSRMYKTQKTILSESVDMFSMITKLFLLKPS